MSETNALQAELNGLQALFNEKISNLATQNSVDHKNINDTMNCIDTTLKDHNGRLRLMEKMIEQGKGASKVIQWGWIVFSFIIGGLIFPLILKILGE